MKPLVRVSSDRASHFGQLTPKIVYSVRLENVRPFIRIAHRLDHPLAIRKRIIFDHEFVLILAGEGDFMFGERRMTFKSHDFFFIPPFTPHSFTSSRTTGSHLAVHFDFARDLPRISPAVDRRKPYEICFTHGLSIPTATALGAGHPVEHAFTSLVREYGRMDDPLGRLAAENYLTSIIIALFRETPVEVPRSDSPGAWRDRTRVEEVVEYIKNHLTDQMDSNSLARVAGLTSGRLNTLFRKITGYSLIEFLRRTRVEEARRQLGDVRLSVKEIAARVGFEDSYHFSKVFRRIDGLSPAHYREAVLAGRAAPK